MYNDFFVACVSKSRVCYVGGVGEERMKNTDVR